MSVSLPVYAPQVDLIAVIGVPLGDAIKFVTGKNGYPAFGISEDADIREPAQKHFQKIYRDFSITGTFRPNADRPMYLFAIVNPDHTLVQFGLHISATDPETELQTITLYYSDFRYDQASVPIAKFTVPTFVGEFVDIAIQVQDDEITLYWNCNKYDSVIHTRNTMELPLEAGSTLYVAQGGSIFGEKFVVSKNKLISSVR